MAGKIQLKAWPAKYVQLMEKKIDKFKASASPRKPEKEKKEEKKMGRYQSHVDGYVMEVSYTRVIVIIRDHNIV